MGGQAFAPPCYKRKMTPQAYVRHPGACPTPCRKRQIRRRRV